MIRRQVGNEFFLITQHDHALLSGELARHIGNKLFHKPADHRESFLHGTSQHDCGWPLHDDQPTLNRDGLPIDVFESTRDIALPVWQASVDRVLERGDDYATLLVSLHVLALSAFATGSDSNGFAINESRARFEINRFQHKQIEIQEILRRSLGLQTEIPLQSGLAIDSNEPRELELIYHFRLLQAMDLISLALCCTEPPIKQLRPMPAQVGGKPVIINLKRDDLTTLRVTPWPFDVELLRFSVGFRRLPVRKFTSAQELQHALASVPGEELQLVTAPA